jgi:hypothetical protein
LLEVVLSLSWQKHCFLTSEKSHQHSGIPFFPPQDVPVGLIQSAIGGATNASFEPVIYTNDHFPKTGSGQT